MTLEDLHNLINNRMIPVGEGGSYLIIEDMSYRRESREEGIQLSISIGGKLTSDDFNYLATAKKPAVATKILSAVKATEPEHRRIRLMRKTKNLLHPGAQHEHETTGETTPMATPNTEPELEQNEASLHVSTMPTSDYGLCPTSHSASEDEG